MISTMNHRGFTLWELLVALALLLLLASLAVPVTLAWSQAAQFEEASQQVGAALSTARSDAQRDGKPMHVVVRPDPVNGGWKVVKIPMVVAGLPTAIGLPEFSTEADRDNDESFTPEPDASGRPDETLATLPGNVVVTRESALVAPAATDVPSSDATGTPVLPVKTPSTPGSEPAAPALSSEAPQSIPSKGFVMATFLPDGEPVNLSPCVLTDSRGKSVRITVDSWTGQVKIQRMATKVAEADSARPTEPTR